MASGSRQNQQSRWICIFLGILLFIGSCPLGHAQETTVRRPLKVGIYNNPPKVYMNESGKADGLFVDVLKEVCGGAFQLEFVEGEWQELKQKLHSNEIQILPDVAYSKDRDSLFLINSVPVISSWLEAFALKESEISSLQDFRGKTIGVLEGSVQESYFTDFALRQKDLPFQILSYPSYEQSVAALQEKGIDLLIASRFFSFSHLKTQSIKSTGLIFRPSSLHFAFSPAVDRSVIAFIDKKLSNQKNDPRSYYYQSLNTMMVPVTNPIPSYIWWLLGIILLILLLSLGFVFLLRHQVKLKTQALWRRNRQLTRAKEKAEENERLKTAFLQNMSHEIRTPMNGIIGFLQLLKGPDLSPVEREKYIDVVIKSGKRLLTTINNIIEISKINSDQISVHPSPVYIPEIMEFYHSFFEPQAREKQIELKLSTQVKGKEGTVITDKFILDNILTNLINNAIKFTHRGYVEFGNYRDGDELVFFICDTGVGIPKERQEAVFKRFVQADLQNTRPHEGSGLGLAIVSAYVKSLGGKIWMKSQVNEGSSFYFSIPYIADGLGQARPEPGHHLKKFSDKNLKILVAEDDSISYLFLSKILDFPNIELVRTTTGQECIDYLRENPEVHLVLMDVKMPVRNGIDATREIRKFNKEVPIIIQTAYSSSGDQEKAMACGASDYITKPIDPNRLVELIQNYT